MSKLAALLFDVDGTLADTERDGHRVAFNETFAAYGLTWDWSEELYGDLLAVTGGKERIKFYWEQYRACEPLPGNNADAFIAQLHRDKTQRYVDLLSGGEIPLRPGVKRLLEEARQAGLRLAIVTTTSYNNVVALLQYSLDATAEHWFEVIAAGDVVAAKKPASDIYFYALEKLGLRAEQCLAIEDSINGLQSSLGAGVRTVITINDYTHQQTFPGAALVVDHLGEPHLPFTVIAGNVGNKRWVDVELLQHI